jgi:hypothetical protein
MPYLYVYVYIYKYINTYRNSYIRMRSAERGILNISRDVMPYMYVCVYIHTTHTHTHIRIHVHINPYLHIRTAEMQPKHVCGCINTHTHTAFATHQMHSWPWQQIKVFHTLVTHIYIKYTDTSTYGSCNTPTHQAATHQALTAAATHQRHPWLLKCSCSIPELKT